MEGERRGLESTITAADDCTFRLTTCGCVNSNWPHLDLIWAHLVRGARPEAVDQWGVMVVELSC